MSVKDLVEALDSAIGENHESQGVSNYLDTGYAPLNEALSGRYDGGIPFGRLYEMYGESSTGKTALATAWLVRAQQMGGVAGFIDWERSFNIDMAKDFGLTDERPHWIYAKPKTWETGNMVATRACQIIRESKVIAPDAPIMFVFDSIASAVPKSQLEKNLDELTMNDTTALARVTSTTLKVQAQFAEEFNAIFLYLNQIRLKPGVVYGDPRTTPGGKAMEYFASGRIALGRQKIMEAKDGAKEFVGQSISLQVTKSKFTKPFKECSMRMTFDDNGAARFDLTHSMIEELIAKKLIAYSKPHITWSDGKKYFVKQLAAKIDADGTQSELLKLLTA